MEVGAVEGKLTLLRRSESQATATVVNGRVTLITPDQGGQLFVDQPTVLISGGGIVSAEASAFIQNGTVIAPDGSNVLTAGNGLDLTGQGYFTVPEVQIVGGGGSDATAVAILTTTTVNGVTVPTGTIARIVITNPGFGYTTLPSVVVGPPAGVQATATATVTAGIPTTTITDSGLGYTIVNPPSVIVTGGILGTATATATVNSLSQITQIQINLNGDSFPSGDPVLTIGPPAGNAEASANLLNGQVASFTISSSGGGYSSAPSVSLTTGNLTPYALTADRVGLIADRLQVFDVTTPSNILIEAALVAIAPFTNQRRLRMLLRRRRAGA